MVDKDKIRIRRKAWYKANRDKERIRGKAYHKANKESINACKRAYYKANKEKFEARRIINKEKMNAYSKVRYETNKEEINAKQKIHRDNNKNKRKSYLKANKEKIRIRNKAYYEANKEKTLERQRGYNKVRRERRHNIPGYRLNHSMGSAIYKALKGNKSGRSWESLVNYTLSDLKKHLEKQFQEDMTWKNYGQWHVDHKTPISVFNFTKPEHRDFGRCWALKNLQPMWATDNLEKHAKLTQHFQPSFLI